MQPTTSTQKRSRPASLSYQEIRKQCSLEGQANLDRFYDGSLAGLTQTSPESQKTSATPQNTGTGHEMQTRSITDIIIDDNHAALLQTARALKTPSNNKTTTTPRPIWLNSRPGNTEFYPRPVNMGRHSRDNFGQQCNNYPVAYHLHTRLAITVYYCPQHPFSPG